MLNKKLVIMMLSTGIAFSYPSKLIAAESMAKTAALSLGTIAASTTLALGAHVVTEYPIVYLHECGHAATRGPLQSSITIKSHLKDHPLALLFPFTGSTGGYVMNESHFRDIAINASGPIVGLCATYGTILLAHAMLSLANGSTIREGLNNSKTLPLRIYKDLAHGICDAMTQKSSYRLPSFLSLTVGIFTLLKAGRMCGEFLYGLTPFSTYYGDGCKLWQNLGFTKNLTVKPMVGFGLALTPTCAAIGYGVYKGIYTNL